MLKKQFIYFCTALMFFTRIPIPWKIPYSEEIMNQSQRYYPLVGIIVGAIVGTIYYGLQFILPPELSVLLSMVSGILLTGGFHEDGFMDICDSFGGGYGKEQILHIMKDSRVGAYAVLGIILLLATKFFSLFTIQDIYPVYFITISIVAHSSSRFLSSLMIYSHPYVSDLDKSKSKPLANKALPYSNIFISLGISLLPYLLLPNYLFLLALPIGFLGYYFLARYFNKHIGGFTGDCLGCIQQVCEVIIYLSCIVIWNYM